MLFLLWLGCAQLLLPPPPLDAYSSPPPAAAQATAETLVQALGEGDATTIDALWDIRGNCALSPNLETEGRAYPEAFIDGCLSGYAEEGTVSLGESLASIHKPVHLSRMVPREPGTVAVLRVDHGGDYAFLEVLLLADPQGEVRAVDLLTYEVGHWTSQRPPGGDFPTGLSTARVDYGEALERGDVQAALAAVGLLRARVGTDPSLLVLEARARAASGDFAQARRLMAQAVDLEPETADFLFVLLDMDVQEGRNDLTLQHLRLLDALGVPLRDDFTGVPGWGRFVASPEHETWRQARTAGPEPHPDW